MSVFVGFDFYLSMCLCVLILSCFCLNNVPVSLGPCVMCCLKFASFLNNVCTIVLLLLLFCVVVLLCILYLLLV